MFDLLLEDIEGVFASSVWTTNNILTYPDNYTGSVPDSTTEYVQIKVLPSSSRNNSYSGEKLLNGLIAIKILVKAGEGQGRVMAISDILDIVLQNKVLPNKTKLDTSYLSVEGLDPLNKSLYSASYFIPFNLYGE